MTIIVIIITIITIIISIFFFSTPGLTLSPHSAGAGSTAPAPSSTSMHPHQAEASSDQARHVIRPQNWNEFAQPIAHVRSELQASGSHLLLYHFTSAQLAEPILRNGLRMSTQATSLPH